MAIREQEAPLATASPRLIGETHGWDPYEVWRTRVLLPRLAAQHLLAQQGNRSASARYVETVQVVALPFVEEHPFAVRDRDAGGDDEELRHEVGVAISYVLLAGLYGLFGSYTNGGTKRNQRWRLNFTS